jgi:pimeloyl-ACP methyl ester carboxylesterase
MMSLREHESLTRPHTLNTLRHVPQSETEWLASGQFTTGFVDIRGDHIRTAVTDAGKNAPLTVMVGGLPRDPEVRQSLPVINKLYGDLSIQLLRFNHASVLYNQPATGKSTGNWETDTLQTRTDTLVDLTEHIAQEKSATGLSLVGTSAGGPMVLSAAQQLSEKGIDVEKITLISPAAYPEIVEDIPYGDTFRDTIRSPWDFTTSPSFPKLRRFVENGGSVYLSFFEQDDPPIPMAIQDCYRELSHELASDGGSIQFSIISGVAHNFRTLNAPTSRVYDDAKIVLSSSQITEFLK